MTGMVDIGAGITIMGGEAFKQVAVACNQIAETGTKECQQNALDV